MGGGRAGGRHATVSAIDLPTLNLSLGRLLTAGSVLECCQVTAEQVRAISGFDRVAIYRFAPDESGEVVAEDVREDLPPWLGMHYPATDIPQQARAMYLKNWLRFIPNAPLPAGAAGPHAGSWGQPPAGYDVLGAAQCVAHSPRIPA